MRMCMLHSRGTESSLQNTQLKLRFNAPLVSPVQG
jgi:hypothetical protein